MRPTPGANSPDRPPDPDQPRAEDGALIARLREGRAAPDDWATLVRAHQDRIYATCLRMVGRPDVAADLTQDTFVKAIQGIQAFDGLSAFSTWLTRIAMNLCLTHFRSAKVRDRAVAQAHRLGIVRSSESDRSAGHFREHGSPSRVEQDETRGALSKALGALDPDQRAILVLRDVQGLDYDQIAAALEIAVGTVKSRLFRARLALRQALDAASNPPGPSSPPAAS
ncbi:MAG: RNA polymerase sigma factor [Phycisphaerae bacterium]|nr:RNA polymerase sigma factor [Phycisphaerae bacterium]